MVKELNKELLLNNIYYLLAESGKKIGELEAEAGVSTGYISRISKDEKVKPGIDFIINVATLLNVKIDHLLNRDLQDQTPTEKYLISFLEKLNDDTFNDKLDWNFETEKKLNEIKPDEFSIVGHPLFNINFRSYDGNSAYFESMTFAENTIIADDCYHLRLKDGAVLYIMNIKELKNEDDFDHDEKFARELWMHTPNKQPIFLCSNVGFPEFAVIVDNLYKEVKEKAKFPRVKGELKNVIDSFMAGDDCTMDENVPQYEDEYVLF